MACDMCDKKGCELETLLDGYATKDIKQVCYTCSRLLNSQLYKIRRVTDGIIKTQLKRFISNKRDNLVTKNKGDTP